jgi:hypothetical protein
MVTALRAIDRIYFEPLTHNDGRLVSWYSTKAPCAWQGTCMMCAEVGGRTHQPMGHTHSRTLNTTQLSALSASVLRNTHTHTHHWTCLLVEQKTHCVL